MEYYHALSLALRFLIMYFSSNAVAIEIESVTVVFSCCNELICGFPNCLPINYCIVFHVFLHFLFSKFIFEIFTSLLPYYSASIRGQNKAVSDHGSSATKGR